jgi:hypothetical protein
MAKPTPARYYTKYILRHGPPSVGAVLSEEHIVELARLRDFL